MTIILFIELIFSYYCLRDIDQEVTDLLKLCENVHIIDTCEVVVAVALDIDYMLLAEVVAALIDVVLAILCVRNILEMTVLEILDHHIVCLEDEIHHLVETVKDSLVEYLVMHFLSLKDTSDGLS